MNCRHATALSRGWTSSRVGDGGVGRGTGTAGISTNTLPRTPTATTLPLRWRAGRGRSLVVDVSSMLTPLLPPKLLEGRCCKAPARALRNRRRRQWQPATPVRCARHSLLGLCMFGLDHAPSGAHTALALQKPAGTTYATVHRCPQP